MSGTPPIVVRMPGRAGDAIEVQGDPMDCGAELCDRLLTPALCGVLPHLTRDRSAWTRVRHAVIASVIGRKRTLEDLRHVVHRLVRDVGELGPVGVALGIHGEDEIDEDDLHAWVDHASPDQLGALLVADALSNALDCYHPTQDDARQLVALAGQYGVDAASFAAPAEAAA